MCRFFDVCGPERDRFSVSWLLSKLPFKNDRWYMKKQFFTLIELLVVIAIIVIEESCKM